MTKAKAIEKALPQHAEPTYSVTVIDNQHPEGIPLEQWVRPSNVPQQALSEDEAVRAAMDTLLSGPWGRCDNWIENLLPECQEAFHVDTLRLIVRAVLERLQAKKS